MDVGMFLCRKNHSQGRFKRFPDPHFKVGYPKPVISLLNKKPSKTAYVPNTPTPFTVSVHRETVILGVPLARHFRSDKSPKKSVEKKRQISFSSNFFFETMNTDKIWCGTSPSVILSNVFLRFP